MSGHSKWSTIKRKKGKLDAERGRIFTRLIREITIAARHGGGDMNGNPRLRTAVTAGKAANMPAKNIDNAIKKGTGELPGTVYEENSYEGYGTAGVAIMVEVLSDNKNRTTAEMRHIFSKYGGNMGENGCVAWLFEPKGVIAVAKSVIAEEKLFELAVEAGAEDVNTEDDESFEVYTAVANLSQVTQALEAASIPMQSAEMSRIPSNTVMLGEDEMRKLMKLLDALEENDDVQKVYSNFDAPPEVLEKLQNEE